MVVMLKQCTILLLVVIFTPSCLCGICPENYYRPSPSSACVACAATCACEPIEDTVNSETVSMSYSASVTSTASKTNVKSPTFTSTDLPSATMTVVPPPTQTLTPSVTVMLTRSVTAVETPSPAPTPTSTPSSSPTLVPTETPPLTHTSTRKATDTMPATRSPTHPETASQLLTPTKLPTNSRTAVGARSYSESATWYRNRNRTATPSTSLRASRSASWYFINDTTAAPRWTAPEGLQTRGIIFTTLGCLILLALLCVAGGLYYTKKKQWDRMNELEKLHTFFVVKGELEDEEERPRSAMKPIGAGNIFGKKAVQPTHEGDPNGDDTLEMPLVDPQSTLAAVAENANEEGEQPEEPQEPEEPEEVQRLVEHTKGVTCVAATPDGMFIISGSRDCTIHVCTKVAVGVLSGHTDEVTSVCSTPDSQFVVSGSKDKTIRIWSLRTGQEVQKLEAHRGAVLSVCVSPKGRYIVSGSADKTICVWELATGNGIKQLHGHLDAVTSVCITQDGRYIISASRDKTVRVWDLCDKAKAFDPEPVNYTMVKRGDDAQPDKNTSEAPEMTEEMKEHDVLPADPPTPKKELVPKATVNDDDI